MIWQDWLLIVGSIVSIVELVILVAIFVDDHAMRKMAEDSLAISRESLEAQKQYLDLRRRWYQSRTKKKDNDKTDVGLSTSDSANS
jgi:hypothetical protein